MQEGGYVNGKTPEELLDSIKNIFSGENETLNNFMRTLGIIVGVVLVIILLPIISPLLKIIAVPFVMLASAIKKKGGKDENT
jgi:ATP/ADP translocase